MNSSIQNSTLLIPFSLSKDEFVRMFKEEVGKTRHVPIDFFARASFDISAYYVPVYLFKGEIQTDWTGTRYSTIQTMTKRGSFNQRLENNTSTVAKPLSSNSMEEFSSLSPACREESIPEILWTYLNGHKFEMKNFRNNLESPDKLGSYQESVRIVERSNSAEIVWEDYAKSAIKTAKEKETKSNAADDGFQDVRVNSFLRRGSSSQELYIPCWFMNISYGRSQYSAFTIANEQASRLTVKLPESKMANLTSKIDTLVMVISFFVIPFYTVKLFNLICALLNIYIERWWAVILYYIVSWVIGIFFWKKILNLCESLMHKLKLKLAQQFSSNL